MSVHKKNQNSFKTAIIPIVFFLITLIYGLFVHPSAFGGGMLPIEILILISFCFSALYAMKRGYTWEQVQESVTNKISEAIPVVLILFSIGALIGSWIVSGTIPMLIYYGISAVSPDWIYIFSFFICIVFSLLTGTSWGSAGTIGVVMMGISQVYGADPAMTAGAVVGGAYFGDKLSPLSDTTNVAALAAGVPLLVHIRSMLYTTLPSALIASVLYVLWSPAIRSGSQDLGNLRLTEIENSLYNLQSIFNFHWILILPLLVIIWGSLRQKPILLTLLGSSFLAMVLAFIYQDFALADIFASLNTGFRVQMAGDISIRSDVVSILNRGGLYNLIEGIVICLLIFAYIGTLDVMQAVQTTINRMMVNLKQRSHAVAGALSASLMTNLMTSNQYATSFIVGEAFNSKFDDLGIKRKVLSRSMEDAGTMMENLAPWTPAGIFMATTLGVPTFEYLPWQFLSLINIVIAYFFAFTGIACFYQNQK